MLRHLRRLRGGNKPLSQWLEPAWLRRGSIEINSYTHTLCEAAEPAGLDSRYLLEFWQMGGLNHLTYDLKGRRECHHSCGKILDLIYPISYVQCCKIHWDLKGSCPSLWRWWRYCQKRACPKDVLISSHQFLKKRIQCVVKCGDAFLHLHTVLKRGREVCPPMGVYILN